MIKWYWLHIIVEAQREVEYKGWCEEREVRCREKRGYMRWKRKRKDWTEEEKDEKGNGRRRKRKKEGAVRDERRKTKETQEGLWGECLMMKERWLKRWKSLPVLSCMCFPAAVMVRETDKRHFYRPSAVSEHQGASCSALPSLLLTQTQTKCVFDVNVRTSVVTKKKERGSKW